jgi:choline dehydrogenase-like flavoprotein
MPVLDIHMRYGDGVARTVAAARERLSTILDRAGFRFTLGPSLDRLIPGSSVHYAGAARMHSSPEYGVLDGWNRLHDASNVAVVDASCFTTAVEKNPTLTAMALAVRAAERLAHDLQNDAPRPRDKRLYAVPSVR